MTSDAFTDVTQNDPPEPVHVCDWASAWPTGHPLPPEDPAKLTGPEVGALVAFSYRDRPAVVARVEARSYVWSPGECRSKGGYRHYDWSVITDRANGGRVVVNDADLTVLTPGMSIELVPA